MILLDPKYKLEQDRAREEGDLRDRRQLPGHRRLRRGRRLVRAATRRRTRKGENADKALTDAIVLRLGLGQEDQAIADVDAVQQVLRRDEAGADRADRVRHRRPLRRQGGLGRTRASASSGAMSAHRQERDADIQVQAHALSARALREAEAATQARREYDKVRELWNDPAAAPRRRSTTHRRRGRASKQRRLGKALDAVGEATSSSPSRSARRSIRLSSPNTRARAQGRRQEAHQDQGQATGSKKKRPRIEEASKEYKKIVELQPVPPPRWVIAAGSRVGQMWGNFVDEFRAAPIPRTGRNGSSRTSDLTCDDSAATTTSTSTRRREPRSRQAKPRVQALPRLLGEVPVLRRVLARLRGVAREELQDRVPRRRRVPRRADAVERAVSTTSRRRSSSAGRRTASRPTPRPPTRRPSDRGDDGQADGQADDGEEARRQARSRRSNRREERSDEASHRRRHDGDRAAARSRLRRRLRRRQRGGGGAEDAQRPRGRHAATPVARRRRRSKFNAALDALDAHDKANDWNDASVHDDGAGSSDGGDGSRATGTFPEAIYDAGSRTSAASNDKEAQGAVPSRRSTTTRSSTARASQLALYAVQRGGRAERRRGHQRARASGSPTRSSRTSRRSSTSRCSRWSATRQHGATQRRRERPRPRAKKNMQRALAIDDGFMPAFNQLALYYLEQREAEGGGGEEVERVATERGKAKQGRHAGARARGARLLAGHPQEPELRADPQHGRADPGRARATSTAP